MTAPHPHTSDIQAVNLISADDYQFTTWLAGPLASAPLRFGRIQRGVHTWGINHAEVEFSGSLATALGLPQTVDDDHLFPSVGIDGLRRIHVWPNMHLNVMRYARSVDPHTSNTWQSMSGWVDASSELPSVDVRNSYPIPVHYPDGTLQFWNRTGPIQSTSGKSDFHYWERGPSATTWGSRVLLFQGLSVPNAGGVGIPGGDATSHVDDPTNWSAYFTNPVVEPAWGPNPGRLHVCWVWRAAGLVEDTNFMAAYGYSDDKGATWKAIDGTALTVPITPLNSIAARFPGSAFVKSIARSANVVVADLDWAGHEIVAGQTLRVWVGSPTSTFNGTFTVASVGNPTATSIAWGQAAADDPAGGTGSVSRFAEDLNWGGLTVDHLGLPHALVSGTTGPGVRYIRRNAANTAWTQTFLSNPFAGITHIGRKNAFWLRDQLWMLTTTQPQAERRQRLIRVTGPSNPSVMMSGVVSFGGWEPSADPEAYRRFGRVESLACDGPKPRVFVFGGPTRRTAV